MKTNIELIKQLAKLGVFKLEYPDNKMPYDIIIETDMGVEKRVVIDNVTDEELPLMVMATQLKTVKKIEKMLKFLCGITVIGIVIIGVLIIF